MGARERRWVRNARRRVQGQATMGTQCPTTGTGSGDDGCCSCDDGGDRATMAKIARRRVAGRATTGRRSGDNESDPARTRRGHSI